jgi:hypothetical protein
LNPQTYISALNRGFGGNCSIPIFTILIQYIGKIYIIEKIIL